MQKASCCVPVSPLRKEPSHRSEMVSQQLFGETCTISEIQKDWIKIICDYDNYEGWCQQSHVRETENIDHGNEISLTDDFINVVEYYHELMLVPMGCNVTGVKNKTGIWGDENIVYGGKIWNGSETTINAEVIKKIAFKFLNTAYLWGGKSVFGVDCSGFVQTVYKYLNIKLLRDASQQITQGEITSMEKVKTGDLAFFNNQEGNITHVGIMLNNKSVIHASGKVRVDIIDEEGIINYQTLERTHKLHSLKSYF